MTHFRQIFAGIYSSTAAKSEWNEVRADYTVLQSKSKPLTDYFTLTVLQKGISYSKKIIWIRNSLLKISLQIFH